MKKVADAILKSKGFYGKMMQNDFYERLLFCFMILRKINAGMSLVTTVLLLDHAVFLSVWMLSRCSIQKSANFMSWIMAALMVLHAVISLFLAIRSRKGAKKRKCNRYSQWNIPTLIQRVSGILMLLLLALHIAGAANHFQPVMLHAILHPLFFAAALAHISVSASKALITLGIGNARVIRIVDVVMAVICGATFAAGVVGFYLCLFMGVAK